MRFSRILFFCFAFTLLTSSVFAQTPWFDNTFLVISAKTEKILNTFYGRLESIPEISPVLKDFEEIVFENSGLKPRKDLKNAGVIVFAGQKGAPNMVGFVAGNFTSEKILAELESVAGLNLPVKKAKIQVQKIGKHKIINFGNSKKNKAISMIFPRPGLMLWGKKSFITDVAEEKYSIKTAPVTVEAKCARYEFFAMLETAVIQNLFSDKGKSPLKFAKGFIQMFGKAELGIAGNKITASFDCNTTETAKNLKAFLEGQVAGLKMVLENQKNVIRKPGKEAGWLPKAFGYLIQKSLTLIAESVLNQTNFVQTDKLVSVNSQLPSFAADLLNPATIGIAAAIAIPNFTKARAKAQKRACFSTQRNLMAAIEMYNLDHPKENINEITPEIINQLISGKYLAYNFHLVTKKCQFEVIGELGKGGKIRCKIHGPDSEELKK